MKERERAEAATGAQTNELAENEAVPGETERIDIIINMDEQESIKDKDDNLRYNDDAGDITLNELD